MSQVVICRNYSMTCKKGVNLSLRNFAATPYASDELLQFHRDDPSDMMTGLRKLELLPEFPEMVCFYGKIWGFRS